jgi:hypothetical protein
MWMEDGRVWGRRGSADGGAADAPALDGPGFRRGCPPPTGGGVGGGSLFVFNDTMILKDCPSNDVLVGQEHPKIYC